MSRLDYPFAVQPLEGNSLVEVHRILAGQLLYPAPSAGYVPDGYTPLYFYVAAVAARVLGVSYLALRLVSLLSSLACFALLARLVQRETGSRAAGVGAAGVFAATYFVTGTWFDVARVDSLFLALSIGGLYAVRQMRDTRGAVAAGVLLAAAALTKQTGLAEGVAVFAVLATGPRRRLAWVAAAAELAVFGISTLALRLTSGGWYTYYVFKQMSEHALDLRNFSWFCTLTLTAMGLAGFAALIAARRVPRELLAGCAALAVEGCATLVHSGGSVNDVLPAYLALAVLPAWRSAVTRPGGAPPRPACWCSPSRSSCSPPPTRRRRYPPAPTVRPASGWSRACARSAATSSSPATPRSACRRAWRPPRTRPRCTTCCGPPTRPGSPATGTVPRRR